jgi:Mycoplasma protein of unknown function, DUF285
MSFTVKGLTLYFFMQFLNAKLFNADVSSWDVSSLGDASRMFQEAGNFNQNLCAWGERLPDSAIVVDMFKNTSCPDTSDPSSPLVGPFCHACDTP